MPDPEHKLVKVPDLGVVAFPAHMSDQAISIVIRNIRAKNQPAPQSTKSSPVDTGQSANPPAPPEPEETEEPTKEEPKEEEKTTKYKYGNTQADIPADSEAGKALAEARAKIDKDDLMPSSNTSDGGALEKNSHITIRYGIDGDDTTGIKEYLEKQTPFEATLGKTTAFPPSEHSDGAAPIVVSIESPDLHRMEKQIDQHGNFVERSFPDYKPHATLAYVKPEVAKKYVGMDGMEGKKFNINSVSISNKDGSIEKVEFKGKPAESSSITEQGNSFHPTTHVFSLSAWKEANQNGNHDAARIQAQHMGYEVVD